jgi:oligopeptidase A
MTSTLLSPPALLVGEGFPVFEAITPEQVERHIPELLAQLEAELDRIERHLAEVGASPRLLGWDEVMDPLHRLGERLQWSWGVVSHLHGVCDSPELRQAHASQQAAVVSFGNRAGQSRLVYQALRTLERQGGLDESQQRILTAQLRDMDLRGVGLEGEAQEAFNATSKELAELSTRFGNQVLDATNGWSLTLTSPEEVEGLPASLLEQLAQAARQTGGTQAERQATAAGGPWRMGLDGPRYLPFLQHSRRRDLRERVYKAHVGRASGEGLDNAPLIERILTLRQDTPTGPR